LERQGGSNIADRRDTAAMAMIVICIEEER
jgi:hypothetical protein